MRLVESGTAIVILACFVYLARISWTASRRLQHRHELAKVE
jgi:hypothetical protein